MAKLEKVIQDLKNGIPVIIIDDYYRENEGDICIAAEKATEENLAFTIKHARGLMCLPCVGEILDRLEIPMMVQHNTDKNNTPFTVSIDAKEQTTTGMSVRDRMQTIKVLLDEASKPEDLARPGHLFPLRARPGLLKERRGHTEGSIALLQLADLKPVSIICEIMNDNGMMSKWSDLVKFAEEHNLQIISIEEIYNATYNEGL